MVIDNRYWTDRIKKSLERAGEIVYEANKWLEYIGEKVHYEINLVNQPLPKPGENKPKTISKTINLKSGAKVIKKTNLVKKAKDD